MCCTGWDLLLKESHQAVRADEACTCVYSRISQITYENIWFYSVLWAPGYHTICTSEQSDCAGIRWQLDASHLPHIFKSNANHEGWHRYYGRAYNSWWSFTDSLLVIITVVLNILTSSLFSQNSPDHLHVACFNIRHKSSVHTSTCIHKVPDYAGMNAARHTSHLKIRGTG